MGQLAEVPNFPFFLKISASVSASSPGGPTFYTFMTSLALITQTCSPIPSSSAVPGVC